MTKPNLYWSVYQNLEKEFLKLADFIHIADDQTSVYSMHIANLIVRCSIEIESISKELYCNLGGEMNLKNDKGEPRQLYFDTDCINFLEKKWVLSKKQIFVSAINIYFNKEDNKILMPLNKAYKRGTSGSKWKQSYQALKHDRNNSLKKATIENLLHSLGALYILNLYYKNDKESNDGGKQKTFSYNTGFGSALFSVHQYDATKGIEYSVHMNDKSIKTLDETELEKAIYVIKYDDASFREMHRVFCSGIKSLESKADSLEIQRLKKEPQFKNKSNIEMLMELGDQKTRNELAYIEQQINRIVGVEVILNKGCIYPDLLPL